MRSLTFETKSYHSQNSHVSHLILIHGSTQIRHVEDPFMSFHVKELGSVHEKIDV